MVYFSAILIINEYVFIPQSRIITTALIHSHYLLIVMIVVQLPARLEAASVLSSPFIKSFFKKRTCKSTVARCIHPTHPIIFAIFLHAETSFQATKKRNKNQSPFIFSNRTKHMHTFVQ